MRGTIPRETFAGTLPTDSILEDFQRTYIVEKSVIPSVLLKGVFIKTYQCYSFSETPVPDSTVVNILCML